jgi:hypothetical protein
VIILELDRLARDGHPGDARLAVRVRAEGSEISIDAPQPELIDPTQLVLNLRSGRTIACSDDPEEWVRGLAASFRTPYLSARVVEDTNPLPDIVIERANVREPGLD